MLLIERVVWLEQFVLLQNRIVPRRDLLVNLIPACIFQTRDVPARPNHEWVERPKQLTGALNTFVVGGVIVVVIGSVVQVML